MLFVEAVLVIFLLVFCALFLFLFDSVFGGLDFKSSPSAVNQAAVVIRKYKNQGLLLDLGSARGGFARAISVYCPNLEVIGLDDSWIRVIYSRLASIFYKNIRFLKQDIFFANLSAADFIYIYLPKEFMPKLESKLRKELKSGGLIITYRVNFTDWQPAEVYDLPKSEKLYIYKNA